MGLFLVSFMVFGLAAAAMGLGLIAGGRPLKLGCGSQEGAEECDHSGSCGGRCRRKSS